MDDTLCNARADVAVLVCSSDNRRDVVERVLPSILRYWEDCPYPIYLGANSQWCRAEGITTVLAPAVGWCGESIVHLEQIPHGYLIVLLDDYLLTATVDQTKLSELVDWAVQRGMNYLRLVPLGRSLLQRMCRSRESSADPEIDLLGSIPFIPRCR
jgi:hypothetical protein